MKPPWAARPRFRPPGLVMCACITPNETERRNVWYSTLWQALLHSMRAEGVGVLENGLEHLRKLAMENIRYERQLSRLKAANKQTSCIGAAVSHSLENITS